jgi:hypothetical protein
MGILVAWAHSDLPRGKPPLRLPSDSFMNWVFLWEGSFLYGKQNSAHSSGPPTKSRSYNKKDQSPLSGISARNFARRITDLTDDRATAGPSHWSVGRPDLISFSGFDANSGDIHSNGLHGSQWTPRVPMDSLLNSWTWKQHPFPPPNRSAAFTGFLLIRKKPPRHLSEGLLSWHRMAFTGCPHPNSLQSPANLIFVLSCEHLSGTHTCTETKLFFISQGHNWIRVKNKVID